MKEIDLQFQFHNNINNARSIMLFKICKPGDFHAVALFYNLQKNNILKCLSIIFKWFLAFV